MASALLLFLIVPVALDVNATGVDCPSPEQVTAAIARRTPVATRTSIGWRLNYGWQDRFREHERSFGTLRFHLENPEGTTVLERALPIRANQCVAVAGTIAAIVERHFRDVGWSTGADLPPPQVEAATPAEGHDRMRLLSGVAVRRAGGTNVAGVLGTRINIAGPIQGALDLALSSFSNDERLPSGGRARGQEWQTKVALWAVSRDATVEWGAGPELLLGWQRARGSEIAQPSETSRWLTALGLGAGPCYRWGPRWRLALDVGVYRALPSTTLYVTEADGDHEALVPSSWRVLGTVSIGYALSR